MHVICAFSVPYKILLHGHALTSSCAMKFTALWHCVPVSRLFRPGFAWVSRMLLPGLVDNCQQPLL